jgi:hypothetical protein
MGLQKTKKTNRKKMGSVDLGDYYFNQEILTLQKVKAERNLP